MLQPETRRTATPRPSRPINLLLWPVVAASLLCLISCVWVRPVHGQRPRVQVNKLGSDLVVLQSGERLHGLVLGQAPNQLQVAIEAAWLRETYPQVAQRWKALRDQERKNQRDQLIQRLEEWIAARAGDDQLVSFLDAELDRVKAADAPADDGVFVVKMLPKDDFRTVFVQPQARRHIAMLAWQEKVRGATYRSTTALVRDLKKQGIEDVQNQDVQIVSMLPAGHDSDQQWAARKAIVEHRLRKAVELQGTGDNLFDVTDDQEVDMSSVIAELMSSQLQRALQGLTGNQERRGQRKPSNTNPPAKAISAAEGAGAIGFLVTRLNMDPIQTTGSVEMQFFARMPNNAWRLVNQRRIPVAIDPNVSTENVQQDPRVQGALKLLSTLGVQADDRQLRRAFAFATGVQVAQNKAKGEFVKQLDQYTRRVDRPPIAVIAE